VSSFLTAHQYNIGYVEPWRYSLWSTMDSSVPSLWCYTGREREYA